MHFRAWRCRSRGLRMYKHICWIENTMLGLVKVKYWRALSRLWYKVGFATDGPVEFSFWTICEGVRKALHFSIFAHSIISVAYFWFERNKSKDDLVAEIPRKYFKAPRSVIANSWLSWVMIHWSISMVEDNIININYKTCGGCGCLENKQRGIYTGLLKSYDGGTTRKMKIPYHGGLL